MIISTDTQSTLESKGYENIEAYIEDLADEYAEGDSFRANLYIRRGRTV